MSEAIAITQKAQSNLAFAFLFLPKNRRADMTTFYAFCRIIDDLADDPKIPVDKKIVGLESWLNCFREGGIANDNLQSQIIELRDNYHIENQLFIDLIEGCSSDLHPSRRFRNWSELKIYTYKVACCVGLISIEIFGCKSKKSIQYAIALGHALQITNILRDVAEDLDDNVRIYLPIDDMERFQYTEQDLINRVYDERFIAMMNYHADRAENYYLEAVKYLDDVDKKALRAAEGMRKIYHGILKKMRHDDFKVFNQRYSLSKPKKLLYLVCSQLGI